MNPSQDLCNRADWRDNRDPIIRFRAHLVSEGIATEEVLDALNAEIEREAILGL